jgi:enamine deaminase RidA (YjgF/YER057c/UK114 family)
MDTNHSIARFKPGSRLSQAVVYNGVIYLSGMVADDLAAGFEEQLNNMLSKSEQTLLELGSDKGKLLSATIWLTDMQYFDAMNRIWEQWIVPGAPPARATVQAQLAKPGYLVEIMFTAAV